MSVVIKFVSQDVVPLGLKKDEAEKFLEKHSDEIIQACMEAGWNVIIKNINNRSN